MLSNEHGTQEGAPTIRLHSDDGFNWLLTKILDLQSISRFDTRMEVAYQKAFPERDYAVNLLSLTKAGFIIESPSGDYRRRWIAYDQISRRLQAVKSEFELAEQPLW